MDKLERVARAIAEVREGGWPADTYHLLQEHYRTIAQAAIAALEPMDKPRVKPLVWDDFEGRGAKAQAWRKGSYLIQYWKSRDAFEVVESYPGYQGDSIGDGFYPTLEAAKAAAQADYEARILAAPAKAEKDT
jgi:hypothetical protein